MEKGVKSSEWLGTLGAIAASVLPIVASLLDQLMGSGMIKNPLLVTLAGVLGAVLSALGYGAGRTYLKAVDMKTKALVAAGKSSPAATDT